MEMLASHFNLGVTTTTILVMRMLMLPLIIANLLWSIKGFWQFLKGIAYPASVYDSVIFLASAAMLGAHLLAFNGKPVYDDTSIYVLLIQCLFFSVCAIAAYGRRISVKREAEKFYWLFNNNNLDIAIRAAYLAEYNRDFAARSLDAAETAAAMQLVGKAINRELD